MLTKENKQILGDIEPRHLVVSVIVFFTGICSAFLRPAWCDEVAYVDPGAMLALTGKFVSTAWISSSPNDYWGSSNPGMPLIFAGWFKLVGFGLIQARALFILFHLAGTFLLLKWLQRSLSLSAWGKVGVVSALWLLPSISNAIYLCRLEALSAVFFAWFLWYAWPPDGGTEHSLISPLLLGLVATFVGLHFSGYFALASATVFLLKRSRHSLLQGAAYGCGVILGIGSIYLAYSTFGIWDQFMQARASHYGRKLHWVLYGKNQWLATRDIALFVMLSFGIMALSLFKKTQKYVPSHIPWLYGITLAAIIPPVINLIGIYYSNYAWMVALPFMIFFAKGLADLKASVQKALIYTIVAILISSLVRQAFRMRLNMYDASLRQDVVMFLRQNSQRPLHIAADWSLYYEFVGNGHSFYPRLTAEEGMETGYSFEQYFPLELRNLTEYMVVRPKHADISINGVGGEWLLLRTFGELNTDQCYQVFRRKGN